MVKDMCETGRRCVVGKVEPLWEQNQIGQNRRCGVFSYWKNKDTQSSFIKDHAQVNKQHLETSNLPAAV